MSDSLTYPLTGRCACKAVSYELQSAPVIVHACHCSYCQRESGAAFAVNAVIEAERLPTQGAALQPINTPSLSGKGQMIWRCPTCQVAIFSNYAAAGPAFRFLRVGTLDNPSALPPDIHIYTSAKQPWLTLPAGVPAVAEFYKPQEVWKPETLLRWKTAQANAAR